MFRAVGHIIEDRLDRLPVLIDNRPRAAQVIRDIIFRLVTCRSSEYTPSREGNTLDLNRVTVNRKPQRTHILETDALGIDSPDFSAVPKVLVFYQYQLRCS